jgi:hypothetical protein
MSLPPPGGQLAGQLTELEATRAPQLGGRHWVVYVWVTSGGQSAWVVQKKAKSLWITGRQRVLTASAVKERQRGMSPTTRRRVAIATYGRPLWRYQAAAFRYQATFVPLRPPPSAREEAAARRRCPDSLSGRHCQCQWHGTVTVPWSQCMDHDHDPTIGPGVPSIAESSASGWCWTSSWTPAAGAGLRASAHVLPTGTH